MVMRLSSALPEVCLTGFTAKRALDSHIASPSEILVLCVIVRRYHPESMLMKIPVWLSSSTKFDPTCG